MTIGGNCRVFQGTARNRGMSAEEPDRVLREPYLYGLYQLVKELGSE